jgi:antitoxin VapB
MALSIRNPETERLVRRLAKKTGRTLTEAIHDAVAARLAGEDALPPDHARVTRALNQLAEEAAPYVVHDPRTDDEIVGYDEHGAPS